MGKRIISRARGKGGPHYKSPGHRFKGKVSYPRAEAVVIDIIHDPARDAPLAKLKTKDGYEKLIVPALGTKVGDKIDMKTPVNGNVIPIGKVPKGKFVFSMEMRPGSGPKLCRSAGTKAIVFSQEENRTIVQMPSKVFKNFDPRCLVTMGVAAGGGQHTKKLVKAGQAFHRAKARNKLWPRTSASSMNAVDHPFGGQTNPGRQKSVSRNRPPGAKVGTLAPRRTGRKKR